MIVKKGSATCGTAHGICASNTKTVIFTDTGEMRIKSLNVESREINIVGTGQAGSIDKRKGTASFIQPTGICSEGNSLFASMQPMKEILNYLSVLLKTFGVHSPGEQRDVYPLSDGIKPA